MAREVGMGRLTYEMIASNNQHFIVTHFIVNDIKEAIKKYAKADLLDIGCGNKPYAKLFEGFVNQYVGCDIVQSSENIVDHLCPANQLVFPDESFDTVFSTQVIEHVADHNGMVSEAYRVLKKGGYGIFTMPFCWELHEEPFDFFRFSKYGLHYLFSKHGFEIIDIKPNGGKWASVFQLNLNILLSTRKYKTLRSKLIKLLFIRLGLIVIYNKLAIWLDKKYFDDILTLNYIVIVKK